MARMMARGRYVVPAWRYCCDGHDWTPYDNGQQRARERRQWQHDAHQQAQEWADDHERPPETPPTVT